MAAAANWSFCDGRRRGSGSKSFLGEGASRLVQQAHFFPAASRFGSCETPFDIRTTKPQPRLMPATRLRRTTLGSHETASVCEENRFDTGFNPCRTSVSQSPTKITDDYLKSPPFRCFKLPVMMKGVTLIRGSCAKWNGDHSWLMWLRSSPVCVRWGRCRWRCVSQKPIILHLNFYTNWLSLKSS